MALTKSDLTQIDKRLGKRFNDLDKRLDRRFGKQKEEILEEVDKKINNSKYELFDKIDEQAEKYENLLTKFKSDFFEKIDPVLKELTTAREERPLIENRLAKLEKIHPKGKHVLAS